MLYEVITMLGGFLGSEVQVKVRELDGDAADVPPSLVETRKVAEQNGRQQLEDRANSDPGVQAALKALGGTIQEVKSLSSKEGDA